MSKFLKKILGKKDKSNDMSFDEVIEKAKEWEAQRKASGQPSGQVFTPASSEETLKRGGFSDEPNVAPVPVETTLAEEAPAPSAEVLPSIESIAVETAPVDPPIEQPGPEIYVVQAGDSLSAISLRVYGDASAYMRIFEANRDKITDPNLIYPGQELVIPR